MRRHRMEAATWSPKQGKSSGRLLSFKHRTMNCEILPMMGV